MPRPRSMSRVAAVLLVVANVVGPSAGAAAVHYEPPVDGVIIDGFRPPATPYGPGNRGVDYATAPGAPVWAAAAGEVVFAGLVGGARHVSVRHADGLRTSYSFMATVTVAPGRRVAAHEVIGTSSGVLHFGVRAGETYLDPTAVLAGAPAEVRLVAEPVDVAPGIRAEGIALVMAVANQLTGGRVEVARHYTSELAPGPRLARLSRTLLDWWPRRGDCTPAAITPPPPTDRRIAVLVGGLGTTDRQAAVDQVDTNALGYSPADVVRFSYAGGRTPGRPHAGALLALPSAPYAAPDTQGDLLLAAGRLRELLAAVATLEPGVPIDLIAHSQGGVVAQIALTDLASGPALPGQLDLVATLGAPHSGTDVATAAAAVRGEPAGAEALDWLGDRLGLGFDPGAPAVAQVSEWSPLMADLAAAPRPPGVRLLAVGARGDIVVPAGHTRLWDAPHPVIDLMSPDAHTQLPGDPATTRELARALAGQPPTCEGTADILADHGAAEVISWAEDALGFAAWRRAVAV